MTHNQSIAAAHFLAIHTSGTKFYEAFLFISGSFDYTEQLLMEDGFKAFSEFNRYSDSKAVCVIRYGSVDQINVGGRAILVTADTKGQDPAEYFLKKVKEKTKGGYTEFNSDIKLIAPEARKMRVGIERTEVDSENGFGRSMYCRPRTPSELGEPKGFIGKITPDFYKILESFGELNSILTGKELCNELNIMSLNLYMTESEFERCKDLTPEEEIERDEESWGVW